MKSSEDLVLEFRAAFEKLPPEYKMREVDRAWCIVHKGRFIVLEDHDTGKLIKFLDMKNLIEYFFQKKNLSVDRSSIYKVLRGERPNVFGYKVYYEDAN